MKKWRMQDILKEAFPEYEASGFTRSEIVIIIPFLLIYSIPMMFWRVNPPIQGWGISNPWNEQRYTEGTGYTIFLSDFVEATTIGCDFFDYPCKNLGSVTSEKTMEEVHMLDKNVGGGGKRDLWDRCSQEIENLSLPHFDSLIYFELCRWEFAAGKIIRREKKKGDLKIISPSNVGVGLVGEKDLMETLIGWLLPLLLSVHETGNLVKIYWFIGVDIPSSTAIW